MSAKPKRGPIAILGLVACLAAGQVSAATPTPVRHKDHRPPAHDAHHRGGDMFSRLDADRSGAVSREEWSTAQARREEARKQRHDPVATFRRLDANGDGVIVQSEFVSQHEKAKQARADRREQRKYHEGRSERFAQKDKGHHHARGHARHRLDPSMVFAMIDADNNGVLSRAEWAQGKERFKAHRAKRH